MFQRALSKTYASGCVKCLLAKIIYVNWNFRNRIGFTKKKIVTFLQVIFYKKFLIYDIKGALNKFLKSMKKPVFKYYLHINGYLHCTNPSLFFSFMLNDSSFSSRTTVFIWKHKDLIKIVWRHKCRRWNNKCLWQDNRFLSLR